MTGPGPDFKTITQYSWCEDSSHKWVQISVTEPDVISMLKTYGGDNGENISSLMQIDYLDHVPKPEPIGFIEGTKVSESEAEDKPPVDEKDLPPESNTPSVPVNNQISRFFTVSIKPPEGTHHASKNPNFRLRVNDLWGDIYPVLCRKNPKFSPEKGKITFYIRKDEQIIWTKLYQDAYDKKPIYDMEAMQRQMQRAQIEAEEAEKLEKEGPIIQEAGDDEDVGIQEKKNKNETFKVSKKGAVVNAADILARYPELELREE